MISEGSCDTENWKFSFVITEKNDNVACSCRYVLVEYLFFYLQILLKKTKFKYKKLPISFS